MKLKLGREQNGDRGTFTYSTTKEENPIIREATDIIAAWMRKVDRISIARHEAGHVVPFMALNLPFKNVEIFPKNPLDSPSTLGFVLDQGDLVLGVMRHDPVAWLSQGCTMKVEDRIIKDLAGIAGEQIEYPAPVWRNRDWKGRAKSDYQSARFAAKSFCLGSIRPFFKQAWELLQQYKKQHASITSALLDKNILTYAECVEIWGTL